MSYLVFDIETIPDLSVWTPPPSDPPPPDPAAPLPGQLSIVGAPVPPADSAIVIPPLGTPVKKPRARKKPANGEPAKEPFAPLYAQIPIAIGFALFDEALNLKHLGCVGHDDEPKLIGEFSAWLAQTPGTIVTFNGRNFDVPVLGLRSLRLGLSQHWNTAQHRKRYTEEHHLDLFEALTEYGALGRTGYSLDTLAQVIGLPAKGEVDGSKVRAMHARGEHAKINLYCTADVAKTSFLLFRYLLMRGRVDLAMYQHAAAALFQVCVDRGLNNVTFAADQRRLLLNG